jgi:tetratricopeptide (TPR) repeat protein
VGYLLKQPLVPAELQAALLERAEGNPLYAEEFVRMLVERGFLYRNGGGWQLRVGELPLPESVQGIVAARLDALDPDEKAMLRDAAVIGRGFWPAAVAAVSGLDRSTVDDALFSLERKELVRRVSTSAIASELQYSFHHAVVRDVAYSSIPRVERSAKHRLAAEWIESLGRREDHAETIAHHYLSALEYARGSGQPTGTFAERARDALRIAGDRALALNAPGGAARYFAAALELTAPDDPDRPDLLFLEAKSLYRTGHPTEELLEGARQAFLDAGDLEQAAECQTMLGDVRWRQGDRDAAFEQLQQAIGGLAKPSHAKAYALSELARMRNAASEPETAVALGREALEIADALELRELRVSALTTIGIARSLTGDPGGIDDLRRSVEAAGEIGSPESVRAYYNLGAMLGISGQLLASFAALAEGRRLAQRFGDAAWIAWYDAERLYEHYWRGAWDDALALADRVAGAADAPASVEFDASLVRTWIALARGNDEDALASVRRAHALAREAPDPQNLHPALALRARATAELVDTGEAAGYVDELLDDFAQRPTPPGYWVFDLAVASRRIGRGADALEPIRSSAPETRWLQAANAIVRGELANAAKLFAAIGAEPEEAYCRLAAASDAGTVGDGVGSALAFYRRAGASSYADEAEALLSGRRHV